jgi:flagellar biosynthesis chaperone FliJ
MFSPTERQLAMAEDYARHLAADADEQLRLLNLLRNELPLKRAVERGASGVGHERFEASARTSDTLQSLVREDRHVLEELRATLADLRNRLRASGELTERRAASRDSGQGED